MERHRYKLCFRNFANGRALGGHMRSHTMNHKQVQENDEFQSLHSYSYSSEEFSESEAESSKKNHFRRRSKRVRKSRIFYSDRLGETNEVWPLSSISDATAEEDVAYCLMLLSRDKWEKAGNGKKRGKYRCETCSKLFKSYQALGGHRASHKKVKVDQAALPADGGGPVAVEVEKMHECPFCTRVFASGQALGGHKRSHFIGAAAITTHEKLNIDLNKPAPIDDYDISL